MCFCVCKVLNRLGLNFSEDDLISGLFIPDEERCIEIFRQLRWSNGVYCPYCKFFNVYKIVRLKVKHGNIHVTSAKLISLILQVLYLHIKKLSLGETFYILANLDKKSVKRLSEELGRTRQSVYRLAKEFKQDLASSAPDPILQGKIEIDETVHTRR